MPKRECLKRSCNLREQAILRPPHIEGTNLMNRFLIKSSKASLTVRPLPCSRIRSLLEKSVETVLFVLKTECQAFLPLARS